MKILHTTPSQDGFYMPAEFAPHEGCLMIWPERGDSWQYGAYAARKAFLRVIETISESESMTVLCSEGQYDNARAQLPDRVRLVVMATDDAWARDVGPTFVVNSRGELDRPHQALRDRPHARARGLPVLRHVRRHGALLLREHFRGAVHDGLLLEHGCRRALPRILPKNTKSIKHLTQHFA